MTSTRPAPAEWRAPTFFIKGRRQYGAYDIDTLTAAAKTAKAQATLNLPSSPGMIKSWLMEFWFGVAATHASLQRPTWCARDS
jgi:hypothetical protein